MIGPISTQIQSYTSYNSRFSKPGDADVAGATAKPADGSPAAPSNGNTTSADSDAEESKINGSIDKVTLSKDEKVEVEKLQQRDQEVRTHEQAHKAVAGKYATGSASFEFQVGPDGKRYAVGGEVSIDLSKGRNPEETIQKASAVRAAALAPAEPSSQDRKVAAMAAQMEQQARQEIASQSQEEATESRDADDSSPPSPANNPTEVPASTNNSGGPPALAPAEGEIEKAAPIGSRGVIADDSSKSAPSEKTEPASSKTTLDRIAPPPDKVRKSYQENTPSSLSPVDTATSGIVSLSMAI